MNSNSTRYAFLLSKISETQNLDYRTLCESTGLLRYQIKELFDEARSDCEQTKRQEVKIDRSFNSVVEMFGKKVRCRVEVFRNQMPIDSQVWSDDVYIERDEDWYALSSPQLRGKRVRVIKREDFLAGIIL